MEHKDDMQALTAIIRRSFDRKRSGKYCQERHGMKHFSRKSH